MSLNSELQEALSKVSLSSPTKSKWDEVKTLTGSHLGIDSEALYCTYINLPGNLSVRLKKQIQSDQPYSVVFAFLGWDSPAESIDQLRSHLKDVFDIVPSVTAAVAWGRSPQAGHQWTPIFALHRPGDLVTEALVDPRGELDTAELVAETLPGQLSGSETPECFILTQRSSNSLYDDVAGERYQWDTSSSGAWSGLANSKDARVVFYRPRRGSECGSGQQYFASGHIGAITEERLEGDDIRWTATIENYQEFKRPVDLNDAPSHPNPSNSIQPISNSDFNRIVALGMGLPFPTLGLTSDLVADLCKGRGLRLSTETLGQAVAALLSGKHIVLTGAPGTGKTTLAEVLAEAATQAGLSNDFMLTTATADWTTFETIGGYRPSSDGTLSFEEGHFLKAARERRWLIIDEFNRSQFDRAFGQLFTVLSGQAVVLPYSRPGSEDRPLVLVPEGKTSPISDGDVLVVPAQWAIIATMNVLDKDLLFDMSFALMRRFAFVEVPLPPLEIFSDLITSTAESPMSEELGQRLLTFRGVAPLGPAIFLDSVRYLNERVRQGISDSRLLLFEAFYSFFLPQFEGLSEESVYVLYDSLADLLGSSRFFDRATEAVRLISGIPYSLDSSLTPLEDVSEEDL